MAEYIDGRYVCGSIKPSGKPCKRAPMRGESTCFWCLPKNKERFEKGIKYFEPRKVPLALYKKEKRILEKAQKKYGTAVLPDRLAIHYNEQDPQLLSLRNRIAFLEGMLRDKIGKMDDKGTSIDAKVMKSVLYGLKAYCTKEPEKSFVERGLAELNRCTEQESAETAAISLVREITKAVQVENSTMIQLGLAITFQQAGAYFDRIVESALRYITSEESQQAFLTDVRNNIVVTNHMARPDSLPVHYD